MDRQAAKRCPNAPYARTWYKEGWKAAQANDWQNEWKRTSVQEAWARTGQLKVKLARAEHDLAFAREALKRMQSMATQIYDEGIRGKLGAP